MAGSVPGGRMRRALVLLILVMGVLLIAMYARTPPIVSLQPFTARRVYQSPWTYACIGGRCERRAVRSSRTSFATCNALCGGHTRLLWPRPTGHIFLGENSATFHLQQVSLVTVSTSDQEVKNLLEHAKDVFLGNIRSLIKVQNAKARTSVDNVVVYLSAGRAVGTRLTLNTDESYKLEVTTKGKQLEAKITAKSYYGVRHGLETLSQMIWWDEAGARHGILRVISSALIEDKPTFGYRGVLVDTGRQFFSLAELKRVIDGMAASKLNTFHWHLTDSQSFPFESNVFPEMARWGAFGGDQVYTPDDIRELSDYANVRGIRTLVEIDAPAHAGAGWQWGAEHGLGELALCVDQQPWSTYCGEPNCGQLNPVNENSYKILEGLYRELLDLTEIRDMIHVGGDEVNLECWAQYNNISLAMQAQNMTDLHAIWGEFQTKSLHRVIKANHDQVPKAVIVWSSPLTKRPYVNTYFDPQVHVIQSWGGSNWAETPELLEDGYRVILSHVDAWYLDCGFGRWRETGEAACGEYRTWQTVYNHRPWRDYGQKEAALVIGGEAALWSEQVGEPSLGPRLWPRASAIAERLWNDPLPNGYMIEENVYTRLSAHRELLKTRGLHTEPLWPEWCSQNPGKCL